MNNPFDINVVWGGTLAVVLAKLKRKTYEVTRIKQDESERIKRLGVYYMCIDDLPLKNYLKLLKPASHFRRLLS